MQRVLNYGSFLQAYALKQLLLQNGADDVYFIDIEKGRSLAGFEQENSLLKKLFRAIVLLVQGQLPAIVAKKQLGDIRRNYMGIFHRRIGLYHTQAHLDILH